MDKLTLKLAFEVKKSHNQIKKFDIYSDDGRPCMCEICKLASEYLSNHRRKIQKEMDSK